MDHVAAAVAPCAIARTVLDCRALNRSMPVARSSHLRAPHEFLQDRHGDEATQGKSNKRFAPGLARLVAGRDFSAYLEVKLSRQRSG